MAIYDPFVLYLVLNLFCLAIDFIVIFTAKRNFNNSKAQNVFTVALAVLIFMTIIDTIYAAMDMGRIKNLSVNTAYLVKNLYFICGLLSGFFWFVFFERVLKSKFSENDRSIMFSSVLVIVGVILLIINRFNGFMFKMYISDYQTEIIRYERTSTLGFTAFYFCIYIYVVVSTIRCFYFARKKEHYVESNKYMLVGFLAATPIIFGLLQLFYPRLPIVCAGLTLSTFILYVYVTNDQISNDNLTDLLTRKRALRSMERTIKLKFDDSSIFVLFMIDLNDFKNINDKYGHLEGDCALKAIAEALTKVSNNQKKKMIVGRFGGDEFLIGASLDLEAEIDIIIEQINNELKLQSDKINKGYELSASIGYAIYSPELNTIKDLIEEADKKLYEAKEAFGEKTRN